MNPRRKRYGSTDWKRGFRGSGGRDTRSFDISQSRYFSVGFLPHIVLQMIAVGEASGQLDTIVVKAAEIYEYELRCEIAVRSNG